QIAQLEQHFGKPLFEKSGRNLVLTENGKQVLQYADEIFSLGNELEQNIRSSNRDQISTLHVGIANVVPKTVAYRLIAPALKQDIATRVICRENNLTDLLADLALHRLDLIIADGPIPSGVSVKGFNHHLGESGLSFMASQALAATLEGPFPQCLHGAPLLIPGSNNVIRARLIDWLSEQKIFPRLVGEFDDSALMKVFGQDGIGVFPVPTAIADEVTEQYHVTCVGQTDEVAEQLYAISIERKLKHPAVRAITQSARNWLRASGF
ncbi:MAG: LysR substrate-binding domain-containing protein, partial [Oleiphilaceae bacterium]|nr:LysR substrate-binding domain-containing protein [Oleiphilaceae bacterium]